MTATEGNETGQDLALHALLRERTAEVALLTREVIRLQDALAAAEADLLRDRPLAITPVPAPRAMPGGEDEDLRARLEAAERHIQDLYDSTSWRVTAPMRALSRALRGR